MTDPGLRFWLSHLEAEGGLWEPAGDAVLTVLPSELSQRYRLAEEMVITDDPDVARSDGVAFLGTGHPVLAEAAQAVLDAGDVGCRLLQRPAGAVPDRELLQDKARAQLPVSHGRIDASDTPRPVIHWMLRVGVLATYAVSSEEQFTEQVERWVHLVSRRQPPAGVVERLDRAPVAEPVPVEPVPADALVPALAEAHRIIEAEALRRRSDLARQFGHAHDEERARATTYYADVIAGIERRLDTVTADRRALLEERLVSTRQEQARRLAEIAEKYDARHKVHPYRLHAIGVPALRLPVDVRRGDRRYPMELDWLLPAGVFAEPRCPSCASVAPLVAGKTDLGCLMCLTPKAPAPVPRPAPAIPNAAKRAIAEPPAAAKRAIAEPPARKPAVAPPKSRPGRPVPSGSSRVENLTSTIWNAVAAGRARALRDAFVPGSPAAVLHHLYGLDGFRHVIGIPAYEQMEAFTVGSAQLTGDWGTTSGTVKTMKGEYPYAVGWRADNRKPLVTEVLPYPPYPDGKFHNFYWFFRVRNPKQAAGIPVDLPKVDEVTQALLRVGVPWHGLPLAARAIAAWWRVRELDDERLGSQPVVLATALHRLIAFRAGDKGLFRDAANAYRVDETAVRRVDAYLRKRLALDAERPW